jgi:hypothetical protein
MADIDTPVHTERLWLWSDTYEFPTPFTLFLDLIGWSDTHFKTKVAEPMPALGYLEADLLGHALIEYSLDPEQVSDYITARLFANQPKLPLDTSVPETDTL